jgi:hypothetical protein
MTTKLQPANIDQTLDYSVDQLSANTVIVSGVDVLSYAQSAFIQANSAFSTANTGGGGASTDTTKKIAAGYSLVFGG